MARIVSSALTKVYLVNNTWYSSGGSLSKREVIPQLTDCGQSLVVEARAFGRALELLRGPDGLWLYTNRHSSSILQSTVMGISGLARLSTASFNTEIQLD